MLGRKSRACVVAPAIVLICVTNLGTEAVKSRRREAWNATVGLSTEFAVVVRCVYLLRVLKKSNKSVHLLVGEESRLLKGGEGLEDFFERFEDHGGAKGGRNIGVQRLELECCGIVVGEDEQCLVIPAICLKQSSWNPEEPLAEAIQVVELFLGRGSRPYSL